VAEVGLRSIFIDGISKGSWAGGGGGGDFHNLIDTARLATFRVPYAYNDYSDFVYGDMIVTALSESLEEGVSQMEVLSDSFVAFATGAMPIGVVIRGFLARMPEQDGRLDFLDAYERYLRGTRVGRGGVDMEVLLKGRAMFKFSLQSVTISESTQYENFTEVSMSGIAYEYQPTVLLGDSDDT